MSTLNQKFIISIIIIASLAAFGCGNNPKVIQAEAAASVSPFEFSDVPDDHKISLEQKNQAPSNAFHKVVIKEVLPTSKYVYLKVNEGVESYWLATKKMEVEVGATYFFRNGLLKTNFESKEHKRTFDKLFLVSSIVPESHGNSNEQKNIEMHAFEGDNSMSGSEEASNSDILSIATLVGNKTNLEGKTVTLKGICTKVNAKIMGRNWIHLKDGTMDDYDLVITSDQEIPVGHEVTIQGTVSLKKDFGSGYYYELLVENGKPLKN